MDEPKVSIIVPVCNVGKYLTECLNSLVGQTLSDIEIICVDDASSDNSADIIKDFSDRDERIAAIYHKTNMSTSQARKDGVAASHGKYIMFLDGDDSFALNACETAYNAILEQNTDMLQFGTEVINCSGVPRARIQANEKMLKPYNGRLESDNLLGFCWREKKFRFNLWNKIYNGEMARTAFKDIKDGSYPKAQDLYAFFVLAFHMKSYASIGDKLYFYKFGTGTTGQNIMTINQFNVLLTEKRSYEAIEEFLIEKNSVEEYRDILVDIRDGLLGECVSRWMENVRVEDVADGYEKLVEVWGKDDVICKLAATKWTSRPEVAKKFIQINKKRPKSVRKPETVAYYYRCIKNGGAQRVAAMLCNILNEQRNEEGEKIYNIVLITDEEPDENEDKGYDEYFLSKDIKRAYLPAFDKFHASNYRARYEAWQKVVSEFEIDVVIHGLWVAPCALWDLISVKESDRQPMFIMHAHSFVAVPYGFEGCMPEEIMFRYSLCDGVVTLSECDERFVSTFNRHAKYILNPISTDLAKSEQSKLDNNTIIWLGRIAPEKHPRDVVLMMKHVVEKMPEAKLIIVGDGDEGIVNDMLQMIDLYGLNDNIEMTGYKSDVDSFYEKASVFVGTSEYEGFPMTYTEALSHGLPVVVYDLPWLSVIRDGRGISVVEQERPDLLAERVVELLQDKELRCSAGRAGREQIQDMLSVDIGSEWTELFQDIYEVKNEHICENNNEDILFSYLTIFQQKGKNVTANRLRQKMLKIDAEKNRRGRVIKKLRAQIAELNNTIEQQNQRLNRYDNNPFIKAAKKIYHLVK